MENKKSGFTLVELLLVIGIIATLAVVVFVALDPAKRFADARDARRQSDVETILSAVHQFVVDSKGNFPTGLDGNIEIMIGSGSGGCSSAIGGCATAGDDCLNMKNDLTKYLKTLPFDPKGGTDDATQYTIEKDVNGIITVRACGAEGSVISASR